MRKIKFKYIISLFIIMFFVENMHGQEQILFKHIDVSKGLSNGRVMGVAQDSIGFIWIATKNGLNRYDGSSFKVFNTSNSNISSNDISTITIDSKGRLWVGTVGGGVNLYDSKKDIFHIYKQDNHSITSDVIHLIKEDYEGKIWIGTDNGLSLYSEDEDSFKSFYHNSKVDKSINDNSISSILDYEDEKLLIGTNGGGLNLFDKVSKTFTNYSDNLKGIETLDFINSMMKLGDNSILIGTHGNGLLKLNLYDNSIINILEDTKFKEVTIIRTIWRDKRGVLWIGTDGNGILKIEDILNAKKITNFTNNSRLVSSLSNNTVNAFFQDNQSNIWIATAWRGLNIIEKRVNKVNLYHSDVKGYDSSPVLSVFKEGDNLWMGTDGNGLSILNTKSNTVKQYNDNNSISIGGEYIQVIHKNNDDTFWIGTFANGLILFDKSKGSLAQYRRDANNSNSLPYNDVRDIVELPSGSLWIATWGGGLSFYDINKKSFRNYKRINNENSISSNNILSILLGADNNLYISTFGGGLNVLNINNDEFTHYKEKGGGFNSISSNYIYCSLIKSDKIYLGTRNGLSIFNTKTHTFNNLKIGGTINSNIIVGIIDSGEDIWMTTKEGIYKYNSITEQVNEFSEISGEFHINSVCKGSDGFLYFGSRDGVISFNPTQSLINQFEPPIIISDFKLFNKKVEIGDGGILNSQVFYEKSLQLDYDQNVITFDFSIFDYPFAKKEIFAVKMEGFDENWREVGPQKTTTFTNLSPGEYTFKVKRLSTISNSINDNNTAEIKINISPPIWQTWWAYLIYFVIIVYLLILYRRYTVKLVNVKNELKLERIHREQEDKLHELKQRFFTNISHEIRTPLTLIVSPLNKLLGKGDFGASELKYLTTIKSNTNRLLNLVDELLNFRKLETGNVKLKVSEYDIIEFVNEIYLSYTQQAINKNINYQFNTTNDSLLVCFDKSQLQKAIYNLLSNAFKFTNNGGSIFVEVEKKSNEVQISIIDSGKGISKESVNKIFDRFYQNKEGIDSNVGFGIGLSIAKEIVELHLGTINVNSKLNEGSTFTISLPLGKLKNNFDDLEIRENENIENFTTTITDIDNVDLEYKEEFSGAKILLIEDNIHIRAHLKDLLEDTYIVFEANNGKEGLESSIEIVPDLIISDVMMPVMDGISFCDNLKKDIRISHIPVILLTAKTMETNIVEGYSKGADDYITKPFNETILKLKIRNVLEGKRLLQERFKKEEIIKPKYISVTSPDEEFLSMLITNIENNIDRNDYSIEQLSLDMAMSHSNVYKKIKALTGMTVIGFFKDFRLKRAAQLLKQDKLPIGEVAFIVGYSDRKHFSQEFKKKFGVTPTTYMKKYKQDKDSN